MLDGENKDSVAGTIWSGSQSVRLGNVPPSTRDFDAMVCLEIGGRLGPIHVTSGGKTPAKTNSLFALKIAEAKFVAGPASKCYIHLMRGGR